MKNYYANNQSLLNTYFFKVSTKLMFHVSCRSLILILIDNNRNNSSFFEGFPEKFALEPALIRTSDRLSHVDLFIDQFITISLFMRSLSVISGYMSTGTMLIFLRYHV